MLFGQDRRAYTEPPDITARICGICPVTYQMSTCLAIEAAYGVTVDGPVAELLRLLYWGEWIESHALHIYLLHAPDFLGYRTQAVSRSVIPPSTAFGALQRLFAGPTQAEQARGLKFVSSRATGFKTLSISGGVARVQLTGKVSSGESTFTVANEIMPTLKQFPSVHWVKIYDQRGRTERPYGHSDSIPFSLEP